MSRKNTVFTWENNNFWNDIKERLKKSWTNLSGVEMDIDKRSGIWKQECSSKGASLPALLQNKYLAVDITDRGFGICPMILNGRYYGRIGFDIKYEKGKYTSHPWENSDCYETLKEMSVIYEPDSFIIRCTSFIDFEYEIKVCLPASFPFIIVETVLRSRTGISASITPWLVWMPGQMQQIGENGTLWINPEHIPIADKVLACNNSVTADPLRPEDKDFAGMGLAYGSGNMNCKATKRSGLNCKKEVILCDRSFSADDLEKLELCPVHMNLEEGSAHFSIILGMTKNADEFAGCLEKWNCLRKSVQDTEKGYWRKILDNLSVKCPDSQIERQSAYSVRNSLFSRSLYNSGETIFIHGRPDRGYGDSSKMHQSYQMHFVALASGQTDSVKEEIKAFAELQDDNGDMAFQLRPGKGCHPYAGLYSNAHFIMSLYRYLCWTGDFDFVDDIAVNPITGSELTILDRTLLSAKWLLDNFSNGVVKPCGWLDAWPPKVEAQAQISIVTYIALKKLLKILAHLSYKEKEAQFKKVVRQLKEDIKSVFYMEENGLFAEHLFDSGKVEGGVIEDFWAHTQIWAALAGLAPDVRGLEACRKYCLKRGMTVIPESGINTDYISDSTDGLEDLDLGSTATWLFAAWPELTHLYAIAEIKYGRSTEALEAVKRQLPQNVHKENPYAAPYYYAEKYLYPYDIPWLCTWSGDPTLIQVLLEGFGGIEPALEGLYLKPSIPEEWKAKGKYEMNFIWRSGIIHLIVTGFGSCIKKLELNGYIIESDTVITFDMIQPDVINEVNISMG